jgi:hypothetical protein
MTNSDLNRRTRTSFLMSLILHILIALVLGFVLLEQPQEEAMESVAVDMVEATRRVTPPRRMEMRESISDLHKPRKQKAKTQIKPRDLNPADTDFTRQSRSSDAGTVLPELATDANLLKSRFDMPLPRPKGASIMKPGTGAKRSADGRSGAGSVGLPGEAGIFEKALYWIARNIVGKNETGKEDIVFLIDASGSMEENIAAVARYISRMIDVFEESDLDYTMGVIEFNLVLKNYDGESDKGNSPAYTVGATTFNTALESEKYNNYIALYDQTTDVNHIKRVLRNIKCDGNERTLDAIEVGLAQVEFRHPVDKTFVLVTDEAFTAPRTLAKRTRKGATFREILEEDFREIVKMCQNDSVKVNVLGIEDEMHKSLAKETGGLWFQIPQQDGLP